MWDENRFPQHLTPPCSHLAASSCIIQLCSTSALLCLLYEGYEAVSRVQLKHPLKNQDSGRSRSSARRECKTVALKNKVIVRREIKRGDFCTSCGWMSSAPSVSARLLSALSSNIYCLQGSSAGCLAIKRLPDNYKMMEDFKEPSQRRSPVFQKTI